MKVGSGLFGVTPAAFYGGRLRLLYGGGRFALFMASGASTFYGVTDIVGSMRGINHLLLR